MKSHTPRFARLSQAAFCLLTAAAVTVASGQTPAASSSAAPGDSSAGGITTLEKYSVSGVPVDQQILPTARPIGSVLGDDTSILDTPRSVTSVNAAWMKERSLHDTTELGQFSPGVYSPSEYGLACIPQIRGVLAEVYVDGQDTKFNRNSILPSFNGVEALDIVKGPGSAVYGPQSTNAGGYVNFVMKTPYFDAMHGEFETTLGAWTSGHSYFNPEFQLDVGGPISSNAAYRISYLSRYGEGYYQFSKNDTQDLYVALDFNPSKVLKLEWWAQYYYDKVTSSPGYNRVTENLIENGIYIAGPSNTLGLFGQTFAQGPYFFTLNPATAYTTKLEPYQVLTSPYDGVHSDKFQTQLKGTLELSPAAQIVNRFYVEDENEYQRSLYGYSNYVPTSYRISDRLEGHLDFETGAWKHKLIVGADFTYDRLVSYEDFSSEPISPYNLLASPYTWVYPGYFQTGNVGGYNAPGKFGYSGSSFSESGDQDSSVMKGALFAQDSIAFTPTLSAVLGLRADRIDASAESPTFVGIRKGNLYNAFAVVTDPSEFASLVYKLPWAATLYATFDRTDDIAGSANFAGVDGTGGNIGLTNAAKSISKLYEVGYKQSLLHDELYVSFAAFQQTRRDPQLLGPADLNRNDGLEFETVYQPSKRWSLNANATYQDATLYGTSFYEQTGSYLDFYPVGYYVDGKSGTGKGSPNYGSYVPPSGHIRSPGVPQFMANGFVKYEDPLGWAVGIGPMLQGRQNANDEETLHIPTQIEWDGFVSYKYKAYSVQVSIKNITNARLNDPIDVTFAGNDEIMPRPPISASLTIRYHF